MKNSLQFLSSETIFNDNFLFSLPNNKFDSVYFEMVFRKNTQFANIQNDFLFPQKTPFLRMLNLMLFSGNKIIVDKSVDQILNVKMESFNGSFVKLYDPILSAPYVWFELNTELATLKEQLLLSNLIFNFGNPGSLEIFNGDPCYHILSGVCIKTNPMYLLTGTPQACDPPNLYIPELKFCFDFLNTPTHNTNQVEFLSTSVDQNYYTPGQTPNSINTRTIIMDTTGSNITTTISNFLNSNMFNTPLVDGLIYIIVPTVNFSSTSVINWFSNKISLYLGAETSAADNVFVSKLSLNNLNNTIYFSFQYHFIIYGASAVSLTKYDKFNFSLPVENTGIFTIDDMLTTVEVKTLDSTGIHGTLEDTTTPFIGKIHPTNFPLNYLDKQNVYFPDSLFSYKAFNTIINETMGSVPYFVQFENGLPLLLKCSDNCVECTSFKNCISCSPGFYLFNGVCSTCSSKCSSCIDHPEKCLACADDPNYVLSSKIYFLI
jgi:hypothetical protein